MMSEFTDAVYDVLVEECGAPDGDYDRAQFAACWPECVEYRFIGALGFGGKVWAWHNRPPTVNYYPEDETPERLEMMQRANERLAASSPEGSSKPAEQTEERA